MLPFSFSSTTLKHVKWLFLSIYPPPPEGFSVLPVPKVNGCSPCGSIQGQGSLDPGAGRLLLELGGGEPGILREGFILLTLL